MVEMQTGKLNGLKKLVNKQGIIGALAIDQRGSLQKMIAKAKGSSAAELDIETFKKAISKELTPYASSILLDPEFGWPAAHLKNENAGLLVAYEKTGYDATEVGRLPDLLTEWSVYRLKEKGADAVKLLIYYDPDEDEKINEQKHAFVERVGSECIGEDIPYFLEIVTYDAQIDDAKSAEYAKVKPHKVKESVREFSKPNYQVDVLKVEVPVDMNRVEGIGEKEPVYTQEEAKQHFKEASDLAKLPFIYLSAGVSAALFRETLCFAKESGAKFNGVLCGRATWKDGVEAYGKGGEEELTRWLQTQGKENIQALNEVLAQTATPLWDVLK